MDDTNARLRQILKTQARLGDVADTIADGADLFAAGLDSLAIVNVMLAVEEAFDIELPDEMLSRQTFASITALQRAVEQVSAAKAA